MHHPRPKVDIVIIIALDVFHDSTHRKLFLWVQYGAVRKNYGTGGVGIQQPDAPTSSSRYHDHNVARREKTIETIHDY